MSHVGTCPTGSDLITRKLLQLVLVDTPGVIADQRNPLEGKMMSYVKGSMREADAVVAIVDASQPERQEAVLEMVQPPPPPADTPPMLVVLNKVDKMEKEDIEYWEVRLLCHSRTACALSSKRRQTCFFVLPLCPRVSPSRQPPTCSVQNRSLQHCRQEESSVLHGLAALHCTRPCCAA